jgi:hypothetical protein
MGAQHRRTDAIGVRRARIARGIERQELRLPILPAIGKTRERGIEAVVKTADDTMRRFFRSPAEAERDDEFAIAIREIDLGGQRDIAAARRIVAPGQLEMLM